MRIAAIVFLCYELFKLLTINRTLWLNNLVSKMIMPPYEDQWQLYMNLCYLTFAVVACFLRPIFGAAMILVSIMGNIVYKAVRDNVKATKAVAVFDGALSITVLLMLAIAG